MRNEASSESMDWRENLQYLQETIVFTCFLPSHIISFPVIFPLNQANDWRKSCLFESSFNEKSETLQTSISLLRSENRVVCSISLLNLQMEIFERRPHLSIFSAKHRVPRLFEKLYFKSSMGGTPTPSGSITPGGHQRGSRDQEASCNWGISRIISVPTF